MSRTDSETKPIGALWIIAGFTTAENYSEPDAEMPCCPRHHRNALQSPSSQAVSPVPGKQGPGGAVPRQGVGIWGGLAGAKGMLCSCSPALHPEAWELSAALTFPYCLKKGTNHLIAPNTLQEGAISVHKGEKTAELDLKPLPS